MNLCRLLSYWNRRNKLSDIWKACLIGNAMQNTVCASWQSYSYDSRVLNRANRDKWSIKSWDVASHALFVTDVIMCFYIVFFQCYSFAIAVFPDWGEIHPAYESVWQYTYNWIKQSLVINTKAKLPPSWTFGSSLMYVFNSNIWMFLKNMINIVLSSISTHR